MPTATERCRCGSPLRVFTQSECLSCGRLSLYDVENVDAFVADAIRDGRARLSGYQREEMMAEGRQIMLRLARQYQPGKGGREVNGSRFSGFAAKYLRLKLSDAYGRLYGPIIVKATDERGLGAIRVREVLTWIAQVEWLIERQDVEALKALRGLHGEERHRLDHVVGHVSLDAAEELPSRNGAGTTLVDWEADIDRAASLQKQYLRLVAKGGDEREAAQLMRLEPIEVRALAITARLCLDPERVRELA